MAHIPFMKKPLSQDEIAVIYAALILTDDDIPVTEDKIQSIITAADLKVEPVWPALYAKALQTVNIKSLICNVGAGKRGGTAGPPPATAPSGAKEEEKKEEKPVEEEDEDSDEDMGLSLFD